MPDFSNSKTRGSGCKTGSKIFLLRTRWVAIFALSVAALPRSAVAIAFAKVLRQLFKRSAGKRAKAFA
ncbi:MAG: hypothetical protein PUB35_00680 [Campylobacteraceae bacterium]|nr:hypothetical protein [Campylobacteraceae bacterium]